uniref:alpha/beta hydrolase n=1 Tax=Oleiagrimonas sp. TaxID=2010330 RepID=UPI0031B9E25E
EFPDAASTFALRGPVGRLEVSVDLPESGLRAGVAIVCHPHPEHGGTMHNKVVTILERSLRESGLATARFNFRGVGASEGEYDEGRGEGEDLAAVVDWVRARRGDDAIWLAGFSFGSYVALRNAARLGADALITVAPPVGRWDLEGFEMPACPWLLIQGEEDEVVDPDAVFAWAEKLKPHPSVVRMPETSHFFHRRLMDLRGAVKNGVRPWLPAKRNA